jgi:gluconate 2-dehydrogenase gamma chain
LRIPVLSGAHAHKISSGSTLSGRALASTRRNEDGRYTAEPREERMVDDTRRKFLLGAGLAGARVATGLTADVVATTPAEAAPAAPPQPAANAEPETYLALNATEVAFMSAMADTIIPVDELSPSGTDCGVVTYIDRQLAGAYGAGDKVYRSGPFRRGKPEQGYQLALTPREYFVAGIAAANAWSRKTFGKELDRLAAAERVNALTQMEQGKAKFESFAATAFFNRVLAIVMEGFFADPMYGGNRNKIAWQMLGFPGLPALYREKVDAYYDKRYVAPPRSIADFS